MPLTKVTFCIVFKNGIISVWLELTIVLLACTRWCRRHIRLVQGRLLGGHPDLVWKSINFHWGLSSSSWWLHSGTLAIPIKLWDKEIPLHINSQDLHPDALWVLPTLLFARLASILHNCVFNNCLCLESRRNFHTKSRTLWLEYEETVVPVVAGQNFFFSSLFSFPFRTEK